MEYSLKIPKIKAINTSITINGAYYSTHYDISEAMMYHPSIMLNGAPYDYVGIYAWNRGHTRQRLNTTFWINSHLPKYRLIFTTTIQSIWFETYQTDPFSGLPQYYFGLDGTIKPYTNEEANDPTLRFLKQEYQSIYFEPSSTPLQLSINLKATKEINDSIKLSFYVNDLMFYSPEYTTKYNITTKQRRTAYFGTEIIIKL